MIYRESTKDDMRYVLHHLRNDDYKEILYTLGEALPVDVMVDRIIACKGVFYTLLDPNEVPVCICGINHNDERYGTAWLMGTEAFDEYALPITRFAKKQLGIDAQGKLLFANSWDGHYGSGRWLTLIGFKRADTFSNNGEPFSLFVREAA